MQLRIRPIHPSPSYPTPRLTALNKTEYSLTLSITPSVLFFYIILLYISPSLFSFYCSFSLSFWLNLYLYLAPPLSFLYQSLSVISFSGSSLISIFFLCLSQYLSISPYLAPALQFSISISIPLLYIQLIHQTFLSESLSLAPFFVNLFSVSFFCVPF